MVPEFAVSKTIANAMVPEFAGSKTIANTMVPEFAGSKTANTMVPEFAGSKTIAKTMEPANKRGWKVECCGTNAVRRGSIANPEFAVSKTIANTMVPEFAVSKTIANAMVPEFAGSKSIANTMVPEFAVSKTIARSFRGWFLPWPLAMLLEAANSGAMVWNQRIRGPGVCDGFGNSEFGDHGICGAFGTSEFGDHGICDGFGSSEFGCDGFGNSEFGDHGMVLEAVISGTMVFAMLLEQRIRGATEAPGVPGYYKSRLSSNGSSGRPRRTTKVLQKSTFQNHRKYHGPRIR